MQITLFETAEQKRDEHKKKILVEERANETFEELLKRVAGQGRRHIGYPCDDAQDIPIDERPEHIKNCSECKKLLERLEEDVFNKR